jgi:hypothetical protein
MDFYNVDVPTSDNKGFFFVTGRLKRYFLGSWLMTTYGVLYTPVIICREDGRNVFIRNTDNYFSDYKNEFLDLYSSLHISREKQIEQNEIGYNVARTELINPYPANVENMVRCQ